MNIKFKLKFTTAETLRFFDTQHNHHLTDHNLTRYFSNVLLTDTIHHTSICQVFDSYV